MLLLKTFHFLNSFSIHENVKYFNIISPSARLDGNKLNHVSKSLSFSSGKSKTGKSVTSNLLKISIDKKNLLQTSFTRCRSRVNSYFFEAWIRQKFRAFRMLLRTIRKIALR